MTSRTFTSPCRQRGTTLIEQIMALTIVAVLGSIAAPSLRHLLSRNQMQVAQMDFMAALQHSREAAVNTGQRSVLCPTIDGNTCTDSTHWEDGWLLGSDADRDNQPDPGSLYTGGNYHGKLTIRSSGGRHYVRFLTTGSASGSNLTLLFCPAFGTEHALVVVVSNAGRIRGGHASAKQAENCPSPA
jgi:type IV fimbrial biogenesis protein FimT